MFRRFFTIVLASLLYLSMLGALFNADMPGGGVLAYKPPTLGYFINILSAIDVKPQAILYLDDMLELTSNIFSGGFDFSNFWGLINALVAYLISPVIFFGYFCYDVFSYCFAFCSAVFALVNWV